MLCKAQSLVQANNIYYRQIIISLREKSMLGLNSLIIL